MLAAAAGVFTPIHLPLFPVAPSLLQPRPMNPGAMDCQSDSLRCTVSANLRAHRSYRGGAAQTHGSMGADSGNGYGPYCEIYVKKRGTTAAGKARLQGVLRTSEKPAVQSAELYGDGGG